MRWYLLDLDVVGDGFTTLCYDNDSLVDLAHFNDRWAACDYGEQWVHPESYAESSS